MIVKKKIDIFSEQKNSKIVGNFCWLVVNEKWGKRVRLIDKKWYYSGFSNIYRIMKKNEKKVSVKFLLSVAKEKKLLLSKE